CSASAMVTITQPSAPTLAITATTNAGCTTGGSATVAASGGTPPYTYKWSNGAMTATATNLAAGTYTATATDAAGCTATVTVNIAAAIPPNVVITASSNAKCDQPGSATASATGGTGAYTYKWDNNETTATATNLAAGPHSVTVTDAAGCTATASVTIGFINNGIKIGDYVWYDDDQNGVQHMLETGVSNITVVLLKAGADGSFGTPDDQTVQTTTTNAAGKYEFTCVTPGTYVIKFSGIPAGYEFTKKDAANDCFDSDAKSNGLTDPIIIVAGQTDNPCFDAGIHIFCDNVLNAGTICCDQTICEGETPMLIFNVLTPWGGTGTIQYQWLQLIQVGQSPPNWVGIPGANSATYQPGPLFETAHYMRCARRAGCTSFLESNVVTITVLPAGSPNCPDFTGDINVSLVGHNTVLVEWSTAQPETDQYMYTIHHSTNLIDWTPITIMMGQHDATKPNHYSFMHQTPVAGKNYYRVKRTNSGGLESLSPVRSIDLDVSLTASVSINPNPVYDVLIVKNVAPYDGDVTVQIVTTNGAVLHTLTIPAGTLHYEELPVQNLPSGLYMARIRFPDGEVRTLKIT
ncbi:MAG TPA: SdrD B-like domain-containing protein, partial [Saprospiraceae bacterium]|nr:SdrD B-like domain-containing protein [Saprospiraceae bacterium]